MAAFVTKSEILKRIEGLASSIKSAQISAATYGTDDAGHDTIITSDQKQLSGEDYLEALTHMVEQGENIFGLETWHPLEDPAHSPAEMLLRLHNKQGQPLPPYPFVMLCYSQGLTAELDAILLLKGIHEFQTALRDQGISQISLNVSARSLKDSDFMKLALDALEKDGKDVVFEIHETSNTITNPDTLKLLKKKGVRFALDDVILNLSDMERFTQFEGLTSFMKLDHKLLTDSYYKPLLGPTMSFIASSTENNRIVAEGVKTVDDARLLHMQYPSIKFVQGRDLPDQKTFAKDWKVKPKPGGV